MFLVKDLGLKRDLAVKVLSPDMIASLACSSYRIDREARHADSSSHS